ncbi:MAG: M15 family metallopeptidase [Minicystis sp.]
MRLSLLALAAAVPVIFAACAPPSDSDPGVDTEEPTGDRDDAVVSGTVNDAVSKSCATSSVKGLALQIIAEGACLQPDAFVEVPALPNVTFGDNVYPFLEKPARDRLVEAIKASPSKQISFNSMMRTVAQQYLLWRWYQAGTCGIGLAAKPGNSNHETGLAFDTSDRAAWQSTLTAKGFKWFGSADPVHFDYVGTGAKDYRGLDVKAFQRLWNLNNPNDKIAEDGDYGPNTEARLRKAPAAGFAIGPECAAPASGGGSTGNTGGTSGSGGTSTPACAHDLCAAGGTLDRACDSCVKSICTSDAYCCDNSWDATCVSEVASICKRTCN